MRTVSTATTDAWKAAYKGGEIRPMVRATIEKLLIGFVHYDQTKVTQTAYGRAVQSLPRNTQGVFSSAQFCWSNVPVELPNIASFKWSRGVDSDVANASMVLWNTQPLPLGTAPGNDYEFDMPGYFSPQRGATTTAQTRWGHATNGWQNLIAPDRVIRTFEGYGFDSSQPPSKDDNLYPSGVWLIDDVTFTATGMITVEMRDLGRILMEEICFPPIVPQDEYPLSFDWYHDVKNPPKPVSTTGWFRPSYDISDVVYYNKAGYSGTSGGGANGHYGRHAFDGNGKTYWMSLSNATTHGHAYIQGSFGSRTVGAVKVKPWNGSYRAFISIYANGKWVGSKEVPTHEGDLDTNMDIPFVCHAQIKKNTETVIKLPQAYTRATKIRVSLVHDGSYGGDGQHCGIYDIQVSAGVTSYVDGGKHVEGDVGDYTDVVKWFLGWGGWFWTKVTNTPINRYTHADGSQTVISPVDNDPMFQQGRIWGDIERAGVGGRVPLTVDLFDKKPLMDCIAYVRDIVGFNFWIDETGGAVWRSPNVWSVGNYLSPMDGGPKLGRTATIIDIVDDETIGDMSVKLSSRSVRERIFVGSSTGQYGGVAHGIFNSITGPFLANMRRVAGWCVDDQTEIFTNRGWLRYDQVRAGDRTLSIDGDGKSIWQPIKEVAVFPAEPRTMVHIKANNFDALTTPNHRWLAEKYGAWTRTWTTEYVTTDGITAMTRVPRSRKGAAAEGAVLDDALVELVAWIYTEGSVRWCRRGTSPRITIYQSPTANPQECESIRLVLKSLFAEHAWSSRLRKGCEEFTLSAAASRLILPYLDAEKAPTSRFLASLTQEQLELFIDVSVRADGHVRYTSEHSTRPSRFFYQNEGPGLDAFLAACALAGVATSVHTRSGEGNWHGSRTVATVTLLESDYAAVGGMSRTDVDYDGIIWCPSMPEHHNWLARRNGAVYYTGNTDQNFQTAAECQIMADLIAVRQMFTYRTNTITIPGNPAIQIDDQVRVYERTTSETYLHYVNGITSEIDLTTGKWTYTLETHWLGEQPFQTWVFDPKKLAKETQSYLKVIGKI